jgi:hypothetical protein
MGRRALLQILFAVSAVSAVVSNYAPRPVFEITTLNGVSVAIREDGPVVNVLLCGLDEGSLN